MDYLQALYFTAAVTFIGIAAMMHILLVQGA
jgi:hypothetical protein